jgi:hypothetical protein
MKKLISITCSFLVPGIAFYLFNYNCIILPVNEFVEKDIRNKGVKVTSFYKNYKSFELTPTLLPPISFSASNAIITQRNITSKQA